MVAARARRRAGRADVRGVRRRGRPLLLDRRLGSGRAGVGRRVQGRGVEDGSRYPRVDAAAGAPGRPGVAHTACAVGGKVVVQTFRGTIVVDGDAVAEQPTSGDAPLGFSMSAACALNDAEMLVFGGSTKEQGMTADAYVLDTRTWAWRKLRAAAGEAPTPRGRRAPPPSTRPRRSSLAARGSAAAATAAAPASRRTTRRGASRSTARRRRGAASTTSARRRRRASPRRSTSCPPAISCSTAVDAQGRQGDLRRVARPRPRHVNVGRCAPPVSRARHVKKGCAPPCPERPSGASLDVSSSRLLVCASRAVPVSCSRSMLLAVYYTEICRT